MRSQYKVVITAGLLCHLFVTAPLVTSQALAGPNVQNSAMPLEQGTPTPTPAPADSEQNAAAAKAPIGNCHSVITSPPAPPQSASSTTPPQAEGKAASTTQGNKKMRVPISEEHPVIIDASECEQAGKVYTLRGDVQIQFTTQGVNLAGLLAFAHTLRGDVQIQFTDYIFHGDLVT